MFRTDTMAENSTSVGAGGGTSARKAHPFFSKPKSGEKLNEASVGADFCDLFVCRASLNNSDPRLRPPICCVIVGIVVMATGIVALTYDEFPPAAQIIGAVVTSIGGVILLISFAWLFITRQTILKNLALKSLPVSFICPKHGIRDNCGMPGPVSADPIMTRGLTSIQYRSCEDTRSPGSRKGRAATKAVHVPQKDNFLSVESTCFQLVATPGDMKSGRRNHPMTKEKNNNNINSNHRRHFEDRYIADNDVQIASGKLLPQQRAKNNINYVAKHNATLPVQGKPIGIVPSERYHPVSSGERSRYPTSGSLPSRKGQRSNSNHRHADRQYMDSKRSDFIYECDDSPTYPHSPRRFNPFSDSLESESDARH